MFLLVAFLLFLGLIRYDFNFASYISYLNDSSIEDINMWSPRSIVSVLVPERNVDEFDDSIINLLRTGSRINDGSVRWSDFESFFRSLTEEDASEQDAWFRQFSDNFDQVGDVDESNEFLQYLRERERRLQGR